MVVGTCKNIYCNNSCALKKKFCEEHSCYVNACTNANNGTSYCNQHSPDICVETDCANLQNNRKLYCNEHYKEYKCSIKGCYNYKVKDGYCDLHQPQECKYPNCNDVVFGDKFCDFHQNNNNHNNNSDSSQNQDKKIIILKKYKPNNKKFSLDNISICGNHNCYEPIQENGRCKKCNDHIKKNCHVQKNPNIRLNIFNSPN